MELLLQGFINVFQPIVLLMIIIGVVAGMLIGSLPGLTATMAVALMLPLTFGMEPVTGILLLIGLYIGSIYGGSIAAILLNTPGTPAAAATSLDGYPMTKRGEAGKALSISVVSSFVGGITSGILLILVSPQLADFALKFSSPEKFALALFGLSIISSVSGKSVIKGIMAGLFGLLIATIGLDPMTSYPRFTFGILNMQNGLNFIPIMIGLFALSEAFRGVEEAVVNERKRSSNVSRGISKLKDFIKYFPAMIRSAFIGTFTGSIPGAGADIAAFVSYNETKRFSKDKESFGKGNPKGIASAEAGNNGVTGGALVPLLTLGIPGDAVAAVLLGALVIQGIQPGPTIFQTNGPIVYTIFAGFLVANVVMLIVGLSGIRLFTKVLKISKSFLIPIIFMLSIIGAYALNNSFFDVLVMFCAGVIGFLMNKFEFPASPLVLALILGPMAESEMRRALVMSDGNFMIMFSRPISATLIGLAIVTMFVPIIRSMWKTVQSKG